MATVATAVKVKRGFVDTPLGQIHYKTAGAGEPLLLLHQTPRSTDEYREMIPILARSKRVVAMDTLGYGDSDRPASQPSIEDYAKVVVHMLDALGIQKTTIAGHHTGTFIAAEVAASNPSRVDKLVLSGYFSMDAEERKRQVGKWPQWEPKKDGSHLTDMWKNRMARGVSVEYATRTMLDVIKAGEATEYGHWAVVAYEQEKRLPLIQAPTLLIWGGKDLEMLDNLGWHASADRHKVEKGIRRSKNIVVPEATGAFPNQLPEKFAQLILDFMANPGV